MFALSLVLIGIFLYLAFRSFLDAAVVFANVLAMGVGGVWALKLHGLNFNIGAMRVKPFPLPPLAEQQEIVRRVSALFARADAIESRAAAALKRVESLAQAVLSKAFRGELVPTEAELARREKRPFESAADLLARVRTTPTDSDAKPKRTRKSKPNAAK